LALAAAVGMLSEESKIKSEAGARKRNNGFLVSWARFCYSRRGPT
jgi:hypothetical protein